MKSFTRIAVASVALLMLALPISAGAQEWGRPGWRHGCGWRHRDIAADHHNLHAQWRDIHRDRFELQRDLANGNWAAAQAERQDLRRDYMNVRRQRWDLHQDYQQLHGYGPGQNYVPPVSYNVGPQIDYRPIAYRSPFNAPAPNPGYGSPIAPYYSQLPPGTPNPQGLGALLGGILP
jgi:hypothetical protein